MTKAIRNSLVGLAGLGAILIALGSSPGPALAQGFYVVQLASVKSEARAKGEWARLKERHKELLGDMNLILQRIELGDRGVFYRMQTGPFPNLATAQDMCQQIQVADMDCIVSER